MVPRKRRANRGQPVLSRSWLSVPVFLLLFAAAGCGADRGGYSTLAASGVKLSTDTGASILATRGSLDSLVEGRLLVQGYTGQPLGDGAKAEIDKLSATLAARADALDQLSKAYSAFASLSAYDAATEVETALNDLTASLNNLATAVGSDKPPISGVTGRLVSIGGAQFAAAAQKAKLKEASIALRERITRFRELLTLERAGYVGAEERISNEAVKVAIALWNAGFGDPTGLIRSHTGDLTPAADSKLIVERVKQIRDTATKPNASPEERAALKALEDSVSSVLKLRADRRLQL